MWITGIPLTWLVIVCFTAGYQKIFSDQPRLGFLADASALQSALDAGKIAAAKIAETQAQIFNDRLDAAGVRSLHDPGRGDSGGLNPGLVSEF